jgi:ribulose-phosphate 3-epimerase
LSADFARLGEDIAAVAKAGADWIHVDVMDGMFVPNITIGPPVVAALRKTTSLPLDVHLMIADPDRYLEAFKHAGADILHVQAEACTHLHRTLGRIRELGMKSGVALNPSTSPEALRYVLAELDVIMIMTVNPGFGGQSFIKEMLPKIRFVRDMIDATGYPILIEVDGGVSPETAPDLIRAGTDALVSGSAVFGNPPYERVIGILKSAGTQASV